MRTKNLRFKNVHRSVNTQIQTFLILYFFADFISGLIVIFLFAIFYLSHLEQSSGCNEAWSHLHDRAHDQRGKVARYFVARRLDCRHYRRKAVGTI
jgi:hypothetical protein